MAVYKRGKVWWFKFTFNGEQLRESTKQANKRVAEQIEAARKTSLAKGEVGIRDRAPVPTLKDFLTRDFLPFIESRFLNKPNTLEYYKNGLRSLMTHTALADCTLETITADKIGTLVAKLRQGGLAVSSINRQLEVLRRAMKLAVEWAKVEKALPKVEMLPGENHRNRVLTDHEETCYLEAATAIGGRKPEDPFLLRDASTLLIDCGLRPEECFRLRWEYVRDAAVHVPFGKTENARRTIPLTQRATAFLEMRRIVAKSEWVFPASTRSGHIEKSSLKKQHAKACRLAKVGDFVLYTFRHTCLTRWSAYMDPYTLAYLAGHSDFGTTRRYVHPQAQTVQEAMQRAQKARGGHKFGHTDERSMEATDLRNADIQLN